MFPSDLGRMLLSVRRDYLECAFQDTYFHVKIYSLSAKAFEDTVAVPYLGTFFSSLLFGSLLSLICPEK